MGMCVCVLHVCTRFYYFFILFQICLVDFSVIQIIIPGKQVAVNFDLQLYPLKAIQLPGKMLLSLCFPGTIISCFHVIQDSWDATDTRSRSPNFLRIFGSDPEIPGISVGSLGDLKGFERPWPVKLSCAFFSWDPWDDFVYWPTFSWLIFHGFSCRFSIYHRPMDPIWVLMRDLHEQPMDGTKFPSKSIVPMTLNPWSFMIRTSPLAIFRHAFGWKSLRRNGGIRSVRWCVFAKHFYIPLQCWIQKMQRYLTDSLVYEYIIYIHTCTWYYIYGLANWSN